MGPPEGRLDVLEQSFESADAVDSKGMNNETIADHTHLWEVPLIELKMENLTYAPFTTSAGKRGRRSTEKKRTTVLHNITTTVSPGKLTAWMGPSGSGKTSLISVAADLTKPGDLMQGGVVTVNGEEGRIPKRLVGVVWQDDLLL